MTLSNTSPLESHAAAMRILVVDDAEDVLMTSSAILESWGYSVITASDGLEAWRLLQQQPVLLVLSDWLMPGLDGLDLCRRVRAAQFDHYTYFILLTGINDKAALVEGMEAGADDFLVKPVNLEELRVRLRAGERVLALEQALAERNQRLAEANAILAQGLESAALLQQALLPQPLELPALSLRGLYCPSHYIAGDAFDFFMLDAERLAFYALDVSGHGVPSALLSFTLHQLLDQAHRGLSQQRWLTIGDPPALVAELNQRFIKQQEPALYFTMIYGVLDLSSGRVRLTQAGHPHPLHWQRAAQRLVPVGEGGFPVALLPDLAYEAVELQLAPGDRLLIYSDGVTDCQTERGEPFDRHQLTKLITAAADESCEALMAQLGAELNAWKGTKPFEDDVTLLVLEWRGGQPQIMAGVGEGTGERDYV